jgi:hypothetical protein
MGDKSYSINTGIHIIYKFNAYLLDYFMQLYELLRL